MNTWQVQKSSMPQTGGNFYVVRPVKVDAANAHFEQMRDERGALLRFNDEASARAAIAKATNF